MSSVRKIRIEEAWWGAWKYYGWAKGVWGVGLDVDTVDQAIQDKQKLELQVYTYPHRYLVSPVTVRNYALKNGTLYKAGKNTWLYVVPQTKLRKVDGEKNEVLADDQSQTKKTI